MIIKIFVLYCMVFCHIVDDYYLQGVLANLKQRKWWIGHAPDDMYKYDYIVALIMHGFSWAFLTHIPILVYTYFMGLTSAFGVCLFYILIQAVLHAWIDNAKANKLSINLVSDQTLHMAQIIISYCSTLFCM